MRDKHEWLWKENVEYLDSLLHEMPKADPLRLLAIGRVDYVESTIKREDGVLSSIGVDKALSGRKWAWIDVRKRRIGRSRSFILVAIYHRHDGRYGWLEVVPYPDDMERAALLERIYEAFDDDGNWVQSFLHALGFQLRWYQEREVRGMRTELKRLK